MASRFAHSTNPRSSSLFASYDAQAGRQKSASPNPSGRPSNGYALHPKKSDDPAPYSRSNPAFGAYPGANPYSNTGSPYGGGTGSDRSSGDGVGSFRSATPNRKGQYSDAVLSELESQNDEQLEGMSAKVRMLKDLTTAIGDEIRDSTAFAEKMNLSFENTRARLGGTMKRMLRMAEKTGVGWKVWLGFFAAVGFLFFYVWVF